MTQDLAAAGTPTRQFFAGLSWDAGGCATIGLVARYVPGPGPAWDALQFAGTFVLGDVSEAAERAAESAR